MARAKKNHDELEPGQDLDDGPLEPADARDDSDEDDDDLDEEHDEDKGAFDAPATPAARASAARLVELLVEKKALALHVAKPSAKLLEALARVLDWPGPVARRASKLSEALLDSDDVDELFVDDETLTEILKRW